MAKKQKDLASLERKKEEHWKAIASLLKSNQFELINTDGSHSVYSHPTLSFAIKDTVLRKIYSEFYGPEGNITVIVHDNLVEDYIIKRILKALHDISEIEELRSSLEKRKKEEENV